MAKTAEVRKINEKRPKEKKRGRKGKGKKKREEGKPSVYKENFSLVNSALILKFVLVCFITKRKDKKIQDENELTLIYPQFVQHS